VVKSLEIEMDSHKYRLVIRPATPEKRRELLETGRYVEIPHTEKLRYREVFIGTLRLRQYIYINSNHPTAIYPFLSPSHLSNIHSTMTSTTPSTELGFETSMDG